MSGAVHTEPKNTILIIASPTIIATVHQFLAMSVSDPLIADVYTSLSGQITISVTLPVSV
jgi:hypothetical protein